ncbi:MAG: hypothetical protein IIC72_05975 [Acidobacteria bacterium]|nr:hypothetical protein [Acidobacteriota bacterium]
MTSSQVRVGFYDEGMSLWDRFKSRPVMASIVGIVTTAVAVASAFALLQAIWALFSSDPFFPVIGKWISQWSEPLTAFLLVVGLIALIGWMVYVQYMIFKTLNNPGGEEELTEDVIWADGWLVAGISQTVTLQLEEARTANSVSFTARQGTRRIVRDKPGELDSSNGIIGLPFEANETVKLKEGYLLIEAIIVSGEGKQVVTNRLAIKTRAAL